MDSVEITYTGYERLSVEKESGVAVVRLGLADAVAVDELFHLELGRVFPDLARDRDVKAVVLTGAGRMFCAGGDATWMQRATPDDLDYFIAEGRRIIEGLLTLEQPVIAAVTGHAVGLGCTLALCCDLTIVAEDIKVGDPHVKMGLVAGDGGAVVWPLLVGFHKANRYLLTGDLLTGAEAAEIGLVGESAPTEEVMPRALELAQRLASGPQSAITGTKRVVIRALAAAVHESLEYSLERERRSASTPDHREAVAAFLEKREAVFGRA